MPGIRRPIEEPLLLSRKSLDDLYGECIGYIRRCGNIIDDQRRNKIYEVIGLNTKIPGNGKIYPVNGPTNKRFGDDFAEGLISEDMAEAKGESFEYSYGERLRWSFCPRDEEEYSRRFSKDDNNLLKAIEILGRDDDIAVTVPIYMHVDAESASRGLREVPCATELVFVRHDDTLHSKVDMRSNDVVGAMPSDIYGFKSLADEMAGILSLREGDFCHYAHSAHIISENDSEFVDNFRGRLGTRYDDQRYITVKDKKELSGKVGGMLDGDCIFPVIKIKDPESISTLYEEDMDDRSLRSLGFCMDMMYRDQNTRRCCTPLFDDSHSLMDSKYQTTQIYSIIRDGRLYTHQMINSADDDSIADEADLGIRIHNYMLEGNNMMDLMLDDGLDNPYMPGNEVKSGHHTISIGRYHEDL